MDNDDEVDLSLFSSIPSIVTPTISKAVLVYADSTSPYVSSFRYNSYSWNHSLSMIPSVSPLILHSRYAERSLALFWKTGSRLRTFGDEKGPKMTKGEQFLTLAGLLYMQM